ncbi:MAG TPA: phenylalanine--tRNA ligase subunit beta [Candidatus Saccharimonadales bacterium]|nr:phenylalanine--tRNA ligase subunit beta [Candidatus Saccharimonadales bacterium]
MKVSLNSIRIVNSTYGSAGDPAPNGVEDLVEKIGAQLGAVEEVIPYGDRFEGVLVAKVVSCEGHPDADRLHACKVDDGGRAEGVERDENGYVQVVCGAPNVREGLAVAWLPPGSTVPSTLDSDPFVLEARALRGVMSNGMLASPKELGIGDNHDGIMELDTDAAPGTPFAEAYNLVGDVVIDMENKMFTHRPDCFGQLGIARELEGIQRRPYKSPEWYRTDPVLPGKEADDLPLEVRNEIPELVPRFAAITLRGVTIKPSPVWLQIALARVGIRPINNIVDYTNFFMIETGQPLHAYDYDKVVAQDAGADHATIVVRHPRQGEKILLLNGKEIEPRDEAIMIATNDKLIGVGGVMGGGDTEVDENTKNIIIEVATFDMYSIRRTSMAHGLFTDAVTRFNKGQSPLQNLAVLSKITDEIRRFADGKVASDVIDDNHLPAEMLERKSVHPEVRLSRQFINERLGFDLPADGIAELLRNVEFDVDVHHEDLTVKAPFWRTDIAIPEDVVEEVGRLYGFDHLPLELPKRALTPASKDALMEAKAKIREILAKAGANELLTYSFVHGNLLAKAGQEAENAYQLSNALSPDLQFFRMSITPSLLDKVHPNIKAGYDEFVLFELNKTHGKRHGNDQDGLPKEIEMLALVVAASDKKAQSKGVAYYEAKKYLEFLAAQFGLDLEFAPFEADPGYPVTRPYDYKRSALVSVRGTDIVLGMVGEYRRQVAKSFKLPAYAAGFDVGVNHILEAAAQQGTAYQQLPRFPKVEQDICLRVKQEVTYQDLLQCVASHLDTNRPDQTFHTLTPVDIYQREGEAEKQVTFRLSIASYERTLTDEEVNGLLDDVAGAANAALGAQRI